MEKLATVHLIETVEERHWRLAREDTKLWLKEQEERKIARTPKRHAIQQVLNSHLVSLRLPQFGCVKFRMISGLIVANGGHIMCNLGNGRLLHCREHVNQECDQPSDEDTIRKILLRQRFEPNPQAREFTGGWPETHLSLWIIEVNEDERTGPCGAAGMRPPSRCASLFHGSPIKPGPEEHRPQIIPLGTWFEFTEAWWLKNE